MIDIFVSYAREDRKRVEPLIAWLEACGFSVWWDKRITPGRPFDNTIESNLDECSAVVVIWSTHSVNSNWVQAEANEGLERDILVPVLIDDVRPPLPFRRIQGAEVIGYPRKADAAVLAQLREALATLLKAPLPAEPPASRPTRRWVPLAVSSILAAGVLVWITGLAPDSPASVHFSFAAFAAEGAEQAPLYASLGEEIAFGLQRATGVSVTRSDSRAVPAGWLVSGEALAEELKVTVRDVSGQAPLLARTYPLQQGLNEIHNQVTRDLAALIGQQPVSETGYADPEIYRQFLLASALQREAPTIARLRAAQQQFTAITKSHPRFTRAFSRLCSVELRLYRELTDPDLFAAAERNCHRALTLDEQDWEVMLALADLYRTSGQTDKALSLIERAGTLQPGSGTVARALGVIYATMDRHAEAVAAYQIAVRNEPGYWRNYNALGEHYFKQGQYAEAARFFTLEIEHVRDKALSLNNLAGALYLQGDEQAAVAAWQDSVSEAPNINALMNLGSVGFFAGDFDASAGYYRQAQAMAPQDQRIAGHLADALLASGHSDAHEVYHSALELARVRLEVDPDNRMILGDMAAYSAALGDDQAALEYLARATSPQPGIDEIYDKAIVFARLGHFDAANEEKRRLVDMGYPQHLLDADANLNR